MSNRFQKGRGVFHCEVCNHNTRGTGESADSRLCGLCFEIEGQRNACNDDPDYAAERGSARLAEMGAQRDARRVTK